MSNYGKTITGLVVLWFVAVLSASASHLFENGAGRFGATVALAALTPLVVFSIWFAASEGFRRFAFSLNPRVLTSVHVWRIVGFTFLLLEARNVLPGIFAFPAGYGDMFIGATAGFAAWKLAEPAHRGSFIFWQALGILDLITAVSLGTTAGLIDPQWPFDGGDDGAAIEPDSYFPCAAVSHAARDLHRAGEDVEGGSKCGPANGKSGDAPCNLNPTFVISATKGTHN